MDSVKKVLKVHTHIHTYLLPLRDCEWCDKKIMRVLSDGLLECLRHRFRFLIVFEAVISIITYHLIIGVFTTFLHMYVAQGVY